MNIKKRTQYDLTFLRPNLHLSHSRFEYGLWKLRMIFTGSGFLAFLLQSFCLVWALASCLQGHSKAPSSL
jgi:predicted Co/Zn/Cd cation transporter (cation efflux family)